MQATPSLARPAESRTDLVHKTAGPFAMGASLVVEPSDAVVFVRQGAPIGVVGAGQYVLHPQPLPFLGAAASASGIEADLYFVTTSGSFKLRANGTARTELQGEAPWSLDAEITTEIRDPAQFAAMLGGPAIEYMQSLLRVEMTASLEKRCAETRQSIANIASAGLDSVLVKSVCVALEGKLAGLSIVGCTAVLHASSTSAAAALPANAATKAEPTTTEEGVYEMLWDCKFCGQKKLLGLTHRFCANCGAPQDADKRYFPDDSEKVAVKDHAFVGADVSCPSCKGWNSRNAKCCTNCGGPLAGGKDAALRPDQVHGDAGAIAPPVASAAPKKSGGIVGIVVGVIMLAIIGLVLALVFWKKSGAFEVTGQRWTRTIDVERYQLTRSSAWCDQLPLGAKELGRHKEKRSTEQVKDGENCQTRKKDQGNGTFKEVKECTPKMVDKPVMADKCDYEAPAWKTEKTAKAEGASPDGIAWPKTDVTHTGACIGCEREGKREEKYALDLVDSASKKSGSCELPFDRWKTFKKGERYTGTMSGMTGAIDCASLKKQ
jgi:hypothetical protein